MNRLDSMVEDVRRTHFDACRDRVPLFVRAHFVYPGAWETNKRALGADLLRAPANLAWAPFYVVALIVRWIAGKRGWSAIHTLMARIPAGFQTNVQSYVAQRIHQDLLRWEGTDGLIENLAQRLDALPDPTPEEQELANILKESVATSSMQYVVTRTATSDIANSLASTVMGAFAFKKFTPGGIAVGLLSASWFAEEQVVKNFVFGESLGRLYVSLFPAEPSTLLQVTSVLTVLAILAMFASFSGLLTDPIQAKLGLHQRRLRRLISSIEDDLERGISGSFNPKSPYLARALELVDLVRLYSP